MMRVRRQEGFETAWVRVLKADNSVASAQVVTNKSEVLVASEPVSEPAPQVSLLNNTNVNNPAPAPTEANIASETSPVLEASATTEPKPSIAPTPTSSSAAPAIHHAVEEVFSFVETPVFFSLFNATNNRVINGEVQIIDGDRNVLIKKVKANDYELLPDPKNKSGKLILIADVFGYRKVQHVLNYREQIKKGSHYYDKIFGNFVVLDFDRVRYHKGDIATLYNVYFFNDAAVMLPESKYELNSLLEMMKEQPYKVVLHGHTNGNARGKIIMRDSDQNFFSVNSDVKEGYGSAKELSKRRAETIRAWLVANGVSEDRIEIKAWGGARMIHDRHSARAKQNVRVEVEVLEYGV